MGFVVLPKPAYVTILPTRASSSSLYAAQAMKASELSHEELRDYRNAMSISRTNGDRADVRCCLCLVPCV